MVNSPGNSCAQLTAVRTLAAAPEYSLTMLSSRLRTEATTRPPVASHARAKAYSWSRKLGVAVIGENERLVTGICQGACKKYASEWECYFYPGLDLLNLK